ncbi:MAG: hypothetical protein ACK4SO_05785 [Candidatus Kapaibacteriota bacterium]
MFKILLVAIIIFCKFQTVFGSDTLFLKYKRFVANPKTIENTKTLQLVGVIVNERNDSLEFVLHRIFPDTLRLQIRFEQGYAITVITGNSGWIVDPLQKIFEPREMHPDEIQRIRSNILNLFAFLDPNLFEPVNSWDFDSGDTNYISFGISNSTGDTVNYFFNKFNFSDSYRIIKFYHSPYLFKVVPKNTFAYMGWKVPRQIEVFANGVKRTLMYIVNININGEIDKDLFRLKKLND